MQPRIVWILLAAAALGCTIRSSSFGNNDDKLKFHRQIDLTSDKPLTALDIDLSYSNITIVSTPATKFLHLTGEIYETAQNEASVEFTSTGPRLISHSTPPARFNDIKLEIPPGINVNAGTSSGHVSASDLAATKSVKLHSSYGNIELANCSPIADIKLETSSGHVTIKKVKSFHSLKANSSYGNINLSEMSGDDGAVLDAVTQSGHVTCSDVNHAKIALSSSYGNITLDNAGELPTASLKTSSGHVRAKSVGRTGSLNLETAYGNADVNALAHADSLIVHCTSGSISVDDAKCDKASFDTSYGNISLRRCGFAALDTHTSSGKVSQDSVQVKPTTQP